MLGLVISVFLRSCLRLCVFYLIVLKSSSLLLLVENGVCLYELVNFSIVTIDEQFFFFFDVTMAVLLLFIYIEEQLT